MPPLLANIDRVGRQNIAVAKVPPGSLDAILHGDKSPELNLLGAVPARGRLA